MGRGWWWSGGVVEGVLICMCCRWYYTIIEEVDALVSFYLDADSQRSIAHGNKRGCWFYFPTILSDDDGRGESEKKVDACA